MSDNPLIKAFIKLHEDASTLEEKVGPRPNQPASTTSSAEGLAMGRGAVNNITMDAGKYGRAAVDYGVKNLGSLAGMSEPTTFDKELEQEKEKDTAAQRDYPDAYRAGETAATVAQLATGVGAAKALAGVAIRTAAQKAAQTAAQKTFARNADASDFKLGAQNTLGLTTQMRVPRPTLKDFELGAQKTLGLTPQMRVPRPTLKLTQQMRTEEENESSKGNAEMSINLFIKGFLKLHEKVGPRPPNANTTPAPPITNANGATSTISSSPRPQPRPTAPAAPPALPIASNRTFNRTTVKGDNLWNMVKKPGMSNADVANEVDRVAKLNKLADPNKIQIGQELNFGEENESSKENTEMSINPFIKGFFDIEEARAKNTNIFDESKKLTAAQKKHLDKNDNDKIDAEDFKMLRKKSYNEQATPRMTADQVKAASKGGSPNPTVQKEFDDTVAGAEQKVDASKFLIKQGLKYAGKSVAGPIGGLIGSALGSIANKRMYNEEEAIDEAKKTNSMVMARNINKALKAAKPDFLDIDKDGDKEESMKKAAADMKKEEVEFSEEEIDFINNVMEAMPVAPTSENDSPNPTPKKKAEGSRAKGSMAD